MGHDFIVVQGARERNLKNVSLNIPRDQLVVISGLSGSGKSSLVFDTIHQEGQRRFHRYRLVRVQKAGIVGRHVDSPR